MSQRTARDGPPPATEARAGNPHIRPLVAKDRATVAEILELAGVFTPQELTVALELIDEWLSEGDASGYETYVIEERDESGVHGYVCFGETPLTHGTYDLYWIAVDPRAQRKGYGQALVGFVEREVGRRGGRLLLIETSSHDTYDSTSRFYKRAGYDLMARVPDFYKVGDDKLIYGKRITHAHGQGN